ncbi:MAG: aminotransferase class III-fold pyridoxal phosphate-dependent enzyme, partial [Verrucomicrobia bacterium]|nr:aminotransferase class III-fold pyridoxal phosphate-dependent enzyme [Verrucomicrobiota bacterium]
IGAFWVRSDAHGVKLSDVLGPGTHATTFGGTPLGCAVALKIFEVIERDRLVDSVRVTGEFMKSELRALAEKYPGVVKTARGVGFILGLELASDIAAFAAENKVPSLQMVNRLHAAGLLTIPSGTNVIRFLPALNLRRNEAEEGLQILEAEIAKLA